MKPRKNEPPRDGTRTPRAKSKARDRRAQRAAKRAIREGGAR